MREKCGKGKLRLLAGDLFVVALLLAFSAALFFMCSYKGRGGSYVSVTDGKDNVMAVYPLFEDGEYELRSENGYTLVLSVYDGMADIKDSDCPNKYCRDSSPISNVGQMIVCAPARIMIKIIGDGGCADDIPIAG